MNLPNFISLARLFAAPVMVWLILTGDLTAAFWLFVAASASDALDGFIAKRFKAATVLGSYLDPIADKALLVGVYVTLGQQGSFPLWLVILVVFRDLLIVGGALLVYTVTQSLTVQPLLISKVNTAAQAVLAMLALAELGLGIGIGQVIKLLIYVVAATTVLSGGAYLVEWSRRASGMEKR